MGILFVPPLLLFSRPNCVTVTHSKDDRSLFVRKNSRSSMERRERPEEGGAENMIIFFLSIERHSLSEGWDRVRFFFL